MNISESVNEVMNAQDLIGQKFYEVFFGRYPEVEGHFDGIDMLRQRHVLTMALLLIEQYHSNDFVATEHYLRYLGTRHSDRQIGQDDYAKWREAMLTTLEQFHGEKWTEELASQWVAAIDKAIGVMFLGYETRVTV